MSRFGSVLRRHRNERRSLVRSAPNSCPKATSQSGQRPTVARRATQRDASLPTGSQGWTSSTPRDRIRRRSRDRQQPPSEGDTRDRGLEGLVGAFWAPFSLAGCGGQAAWGGEVGARKPVPSPTSDPGRSLAVMDELGEAGELIDLDALRRQRLEDEQLRVLATAVGDHVLPPEQISRLEAVRAQLRAYPSGPTAA